MTNEEKSKEIAENQFSWYSDFDDVNSFEECYESAMAMAQWKDEQREQEKQQWIERACEWWTNNWRKYVMTDKDGIVALNFWKGDFKKAMEE